MDILDSRDHSDSNSAASTETFFGDRSQYLSAVAHEIRTPLANIVALTSLMERNCGPEVSSRQAEYLRVMRLNGRRLAALIDDLLDLHGHDRGELTISSRDIDPADLILEAIDAMRRAVDSEDIAAALEMTAAGLRAVVRSVVAKLTENRLALRIAEVCLA